MFLTVDNYLYEITTKFDTRNFTWSQLETKLWNRKIMNPHKIRNLQYLELWLAGFETILCKSSSVYIVYKYQCCRVSVYITKCNSGKFVITYQFDINEMINGLKIPGKWMDQLFQFLSMITVFSFKRNLNYRYCKVLCIICTHV